MGMAHMTGEGPFGLGSLAIIALRNERAALRRSDYTGTSTNLGGISRRPGDQTEAKEKAENDVKPPFHRSSV